MRRLAKIAFMCLLPSALLAQDAATTEADKGFLTRWLETNLSGAGRDVRIEDRGVEQVVASGKTRAGHRFHVDTSRDFDVWYGANGDWLKLQWSGFGMTADYVRVA